MALSALLLALAVALPLAVSACNLEDGSCTKTSCDKTLVGYVENTLGQYFAPNTAVSNGAHPGFNYEYRSPNSALIKYISDEDVVPSQCPKGGPAYCCSQCAGKPNCALWSFAPKAGTFPTFGSGTSAKKPNCAGGYTFDATSTGYSKLIGFSGSNFTTGKCTYYKLQPGIANSGNYTGTDFKKHYPGAVNGSKYEQHYFEPTTDSLSCKTGCGGKDVCTTGCSTFIWFGGYCNPYAMDDPHLLGARGTQYDFNGALDTNFALISDANLQINIFLGGYKANSTVVRSWIKEVGIVWNSEGAQHTARMVARPGKETARDDGFLSLLEVDGARQVLPKLGEGVASSGGFSFQMIANEKKGTVDLDRYSLKIDGLFEGEIAMRPANPQLRTPEDAEVHFSLAVLAFEHTEDVHGVLGQTYRESKDRVNRATKFSALSKLLQRNFHADDAEGKGFLDGSKEDYKVETSLATDCKFCQFKKPVVTAVASE